MFDKDRTDGSFARSDFTYDHRQDTYTCPGGKQLRHYWQKSRAAKAQPPADGLYRYRARKADRDTLPTEPGAVPGSGRKCVARGAHQSATLMGSRDAMFPR